MSGDVQPRKRKDKKKRKDELGIEEPRGTAAALGDGDVFMHSQHDHGTGGHWCAKIIFFSLLAVLITLVGLIILENRGLTELEANSVETKYSGVLEGWIEEPSEDDHYDAHTLDLNHPEEDEHHDSEANYDHEDDDHEDDDHEDEDHEDDDHEDEDHEDDDHDEEDSEDDDEDHEDEIDKVDDNEDSEEKLEETEEESEEKNTYRRYVYNEKDDDEDDDKSEEAEDIDENEDETDHVFDAGNDPDIDSDEDQDDDENSNEYKEDQQASNEHYTEEDNLEDDDDQDGEEDEIEKIEAERPDWESYEEDEKATSRDDVSNEIRSERSVRDSKELSKENDDDEDEGFQDTEDDDDEPPVERITTPPAGKPFVEIEEEIMQKPIDTLAEEAEYEKKQEELRRQKEEEAQASQIWLKLAVGGALLVATHAVLRRATSSRDAPEPEERSREETPSMIDRRMTLIAQEPPKIAPPQTTRQIVDEEVFKKPAPVVKTAPIVKPNIEEVVKQKTISFDQTKIPDTKDDDEKELYSDEDEEVEEEEVEEEEVQSKSKIAPKQTPIMAQAKEKEEDSEPEEVPDDVEIIEDEQIEEELEEEEDEVEEEISDVDDAELLSRLEAKYGRLPEPERPGKQHKDGGNSIEDQWPGEPSDPYWREQLNLAEEELRQGSWELSEKLVSAPQLSGSGRARWILAKALDAKAEAKRDNVLLSKAISAYLNLLKLNERISDKNLVEVAQRTIDRIQFRGTYLNAEPIYRLLIRRFPNDVNYRNNLTVSFLMANRADLAEEVLKETLLLWPQDRIALAHHGFVLKNQHKKLEEAVVALQKALEGDSGPANEARFYYHLGDALLSLGRFDEAHEVHKRGTKLGHFLSPSQRSLYNVPRLKSSPWWPVEHTPYVKLARALENSWREILKEGELAKSLYEKEKEGLKERGEWSQLDIFVRGREIPGRCKTAPVTCSIVRSEVAAAGCRRGQIKFSAIEPGTHIRPHVGPTNCRLRMHLGLKNTKDTYIRVDKQTRQWQVGKTFIFDDSFEHEVWHNGTGSRLVLIVDLWHPQLTPQERKQLPAI